MSKTRRQLTLSLLLILGVITLGAVGYSILEGWGVLDSLYIR